MFLKGTVTIPFIKKKVSKKILLVLLAVGIIGSIYYRKKNDAVVAATQLPQRFPRGIRIEPFAFFPPYPGQNKSDTGKLDPVTYLARCHCPKGYRQRGRLRQEAVCASIAPPGLILPCNKPPPEPTIHEQLPPGVSIPRKFPGGTIVEGTSKYGQLKI
jgi:hypothetical protein